MQRIQRNLKLAHVSAVPGPKILSLDNQTSNKLLADAVSPRKRKKETVAQKLGTSGDLDHEQDRTRSGR